VQKQSDFINLIVFLLLTFILILQAIQNNVGASSSAENEQIRDQIREEIRNLLLEPTRTMSPSFQNIELDNLDDMTDLYTRAIKKNTINEVNEAIKLPDITQVTYVSDGRNLNATLVLPPDFSWYQPIAHNVTTITGVLLSPMPGIVYLNLFSWDYDSRSFKEELIESIWGSNRTISQRISYEEALVRPGRFVDFNFPLDTLGLASSNYFVMAFTSLSFERGLYIMCQISQSRLLFLPRDLMFLRRQ
jgi:hypothetical protein